MTLREGKAAHALLLLPPLTLQPCVRYSLDLFSARLLNTMACSTWPYLPKCHKNTEREGRDVQPELVKQAAAGDAVARTDVRARVDAHPLALHTVIRCHAVTGMACRWRVL